MARKDQLRRQRAGTVINVTSKKQESDVVQALFGVENHLNEKFAGKISITHEKQWYLRDIRRRAREDLPGYGISLSLRQELHPPRRRYSPYRGKAGRRVQIPDSHS